MKMEDIRKKSSAELNAEVTRLQDELFDLRMKQASFSVEKPHRINAARKEIARIKTVLNERKDEE